MASEVVCEKVSAAYDIRFVISIDHISYEMKGFTSILKGACCDAFMRCELSELTPPCQVIHDKHWGPGDL